MKTKYTAKEKKEIMDTFKATEERIIEKIRAKMEELSYDEKIKEETIKSFKRKMKFAK